MLHLLETGTVRPLGRMRGASNETLLATVTGTWGPEGPEHTARAVLKTRAGERPLRDFPTGTLSQREVAAYRLSDHLGLGLVPPTVWREDLGEGASLQAYVETDPTASASVLLVDESELSPADAPVLRAVLEDGEEVVLAHTRTPELRALAFFDALIDNADRKGGHVLTGAWAIDGVNEPRIGVHAIDNGLSFHTEPKLRTILWGFAGSALRESERALAVRVATEDHSALLGDLLAEEEIQALIRRSERLLLTGTLPRPAPDRNIVPWPPL